jgi:hypothetical protein
MVAATRNIAKTASARASAWKSGGLAEKRGRQFPLQATGWYIFMA